ncbi:MAG: hypothetical protein ACKOF9_12415 [Burkholderiales bacterium]
MQIIRQFNELIQDVFRRTKSSAEYGISVACVLTPYQKVQNQIAHTCKAARAESRTSFTLQPLAVEPHFPAPTLNS